MLFHLCQENRIRAEKTDQKHTAELDKLSCEFQVSCLLASVRSEQ